MSLSPQWLDELRSRLTLSTIIGRHVKIQRAGREYKACCPFHNEKTPSFTINDAKGFYHCFGCGAHGDAIRFMTDHQGLGFMDAIKELAAEAGMTVPAPDPRAAKMAEQRASLHDVTQAAQDWFVTQLQGAAGAEARDYLKRRGLSAETLARFGFGFAPDSRDALKSALSGLGEDLLIEAGMLIRVDGKPSYDRFRGRIMIPIRDARGRVIAFGGRILGQGEPKYLNSPDTPLFDKGCTLYNLDKASAASRKSGRMIVVEGYMDAIALAQAGFEDAVAPLGTALTEMQIEMLWKMVESPVLCFDGDSAGQRAAMRAAGRALPLLRPGYSLSFATLPAGQDPDDLIQASGPQAFADILARPQSLLDRLWQHELAVQPIETPEQRAGFKKRLLDHADAIADPEIRSLYRRDFNERFSATFFSRTPQSGPGGFQGRFPATRKPLQRGADRETQSFSRGSADLLLHRAVMTGLIRYPGMISRHIESLTACAPDSPDLAELLGELIAVADRLEGLDTEGLLTILGERGKRGLAERLHKADPPPFSFCKRDDLALEARAEAERDLAEAIEVMIVRPRLEAALRDVTRRFEQEFDERLFEEQQRLRLQKRQFEQRLIELAETGI
ncbi:MAG: DNA primase [Blastomonas sp.]